MVERVLLLATSSRASYVYQACTGTGHRAIGRGRSSAAISVPPLRDAVERRRKVCLIELGVDIAGGRHRGMSGQELRQSCLPVPMLGPSNEVRLIASA